MTEATAAYDAALELDPKHLPARLGRADVQYRRGAYNAAQSAYAVIADSSPDHPVAHYMLGLMHARRGATEAAVAAQQAAIAADPAYAAAHYQLGALHAGNGDRVAARASLEAAVRLKPHMPEPYYQLARVYRGLGDPERACAMLERCRIENDRVEAMQRLEETLAAGSPDDRNAALIGLGLLHIERGELDAAEARLQEAAPEPEAHAGLGRVALEREQFADAVASYTRAFDLGFDAPQARYSVGLALMRVGDGESAMVHLLAAVEAEPDMAEAHLLIGTLYAARRDTPRAVHHYERAMEMDATDAVARHSLAYLLGREGIDLERAVARAREATRLQPTTALYHNTLSWLLLKVGDHDGAERAAMRANELSPENELYQTGLDTIRRAKNGAGNGRDEP
ncbi:tetratricopeptide repeat protein [Candidatus Poribacteria bacterium]|nr:tetratricopeptide repeat protein [Candidatus Poribacteria bacterium]MBT5714794.1 tetratricopeptide repeat protein [Candidatus Poribacteria bacterium]MBT7098613.1 tetratricopeptide repeat protein [Candidatus Poribacteria bacterium]MBT7805386.1 tetratricopeptide repeat protein [Candidatus Poribacteria bacterium]